MSATVRISTKSAKALRAMEGRFDFSATERRAFDELERALSKSPKKREATKARRQRRESTVKTKRDQTAEVRAAVMARACNQCEVCSWVPRSLELELHHAFGRVRVKQAPENCLALCRECHARLTRNEPSAAHWWLKVATAFERLGFAVSAARARDRLAFVSARTNLGAMAAEPKP